MPLEVHPCHTWSKMVILILRVILVMMGVSKYKFKKIMSWRNLFSANSVLLMLYCVQMDKMFF